MTRPIPYGRQDVDEADIAAVVDVLRSEFLTQGPVVPAFEQAVAAWCGVRHGVAVNSATSALHIACLALGVGPGDRVWTVPTTFVASANCALYCGAQIDFVDIDPRTYNISVARLEEKLRAARAAAALPKVVIPVHLCGQPAELGPLSALAREYGFRVLEDASHAIGASYRGAPVGDGQHGDIVVFSFHPVKIVTSAEGGMAMTNDDELAHRMRLLRSHGVTSAPAEMMPRRPDELWNYQQVALGFNYRLTDLQAALGLSQMRRLEAFVQRRRSLAKRYDELLAHLPIVRPWQHPDGDSSWHLYSVRLQLGQIRRTHKQVYEALHAAGIRVNLHYIPVHRQPYFERMGFRAGDFPEAEQYHHDALSLPMYAALTDDEQSRVVDCLSAALS